MIQSPNKKKPITASYIKQKLAQRHLLDSSLKNAQIFYNMKRFIDFDIGAQFSGFNQSQKIQILNCIFRTIEKLMKDKTKIIWMKIFAIHAFFRFVLLNYQQKEVLFATFLQEINDIKAELAINKCPEPSQGLISRSLTKLKRSLSTKSLNSMFMTEKKQIKPNKLNDLQRDILLQYILYIEKMLHDWSQLEQFLIPQKSLYKTRSRLPKSKQSNTNLVWKVFNIFKKLSKVNKDHLKICKVFEDYTIYFYSMINFISEDIQMLYNPIADQIRNRIKSIKWENVMKAFQCKQKSFRTANLMFQQVIEIRSMIEELGNANQVVLYVFLGSFHHNHLYNRKKPSNFISINDKEFDVVFELAKRLQQQKRKSQVLIQNRFQLSNSTETRMNAVNYKSSKLRQMQNQIIKKA